MTVAAVAAAPGAAALTVTSSGTTKRDAAWSSLSAAVRDTNNVMRATAILQHRGHRRSQPKSGTALAPTANSSRWDVREAYRSLFAARVAPEEEQHGTHLHSDGQGSAGQEAVAGVADDPFITPEYDDILAHEWKFRQNHFSNTMKSRFAAMDEKRLARKEREEMWEKLRRKFRMLRCARLTACETVAVFV